MSNTTVANHVARLEGHISRYRDHKANLSGSDAADQMFKIIHRPGWTTPAELELVVTLIEGMNEQAASLAAKEQAVLAAMRLVAPSS